MRERSRPYGTTHVAAARALVRVVRTPGDEELVPQLQRLLAQARTAQLVASAQEIELALAALHAAR